MAITVPSDEKVYTTVYDNFKGVDYTDDASNVFRRRSPDGLNMLPDLDGKPYKRTGWKIEVPKDSFSDGVVLTERLHHFTLGGTEYIMIFNNIGVFSMTSAGGVQRCQYNSGTEESPSLSDFPPSVQTTGDEDLNADANRAFYFEGNGIAGFYVFVGNRLFRFDGQYFYDVVPYIPTIIDGAAPGSGTGSDGESVNMLTEKRTISYVSNGTQNFALPENPKDGSVTAKIKNDYGKYVTATVTGVQDNIVTLAAARPAPADQQDNVRITYEPGASGTLYAIETVETATVVLKSTYVDKRSRTKTVKVVSVGGSSSSYPTYSDWTAFAKSSETNTSAEIKLPNNHSQVQTKVKDNLTGSWGEHPSYVTKKFAPYAASVTVTATSTVATSYGTSTLSDTGWQLKKKTTTTKGAIKTTVSTYTMVQTRTRTKSFSVKVEYPKQSTLGQTDAANNKSRNAFMSCRKTLNYGNNIYNQVFLSSATEPGFETRAWYCAKNDPSYWGDLNYIEVGSDDTEIVGMSKVGNYVGFMKAGTGTDSSVYFAYPTTFNDISTFAVRQGVNGIGAISPGAFNILNGEPLFLSKEGVIGIEVSEEETDRKARNRSWFINKKLLAEEGLQNAVSYIHNGMYYLAINNHCYVLDGAQKNSWMNEKTNLQYECYYLENVPATCFAGMDGDLYFSDDEGNICRFKRPDEEHSYSDAYDGEKPILDYDSLDSLDIYGEDGQKDVEKMKKYINYRVVRDGEADSDETLMITGVDEDNKEFILEPQSHGVPIPARWSTIADDDGAVHFFKNLQKKGTVISLMPAFNTGVDVYLRPDEKERILVGKTDMQDHVLPFEYYTKKKIKKYKRLQIICENNELDDAFGIDQIIKSYTMGNYSKNRK